jgi:hypothetical protein
MLRLQTFAALRHREFRLLWAGQAAASLAMWMDQIARGWLMYELTNSPAQLGLLVGARWAVAAMGAAGALLTITIGAALPHARRIR